MSIRQGLANFSFALFLVTFSELSQSCCALKSVDVDSSRVVRQLQELALLSDASAPAVTRILYTQRDVEARAYLRTIIDEIGLEFRMDAIGNMFARLPAADGSDTEDGAVGTGSHFDAVPVSGMYDGTLGVLGGLEALRALRDAGFNPGRPLEVLAFTSEEPTRFKLSCLGSRALVGAKSWTELLYLKDEDGVLFDDARKQAGMAGVAHESNLQLPQNYYSAFLELHIEQGRRLEHEGLDIGKLICTPPSTYPRTGSGPIFEYYSKIVW